MIIKKKTSVWFTESNIYWPNMPMQNNSKQFSGQ